MENYVCVLSVRRNLSPATRWHWGVDLPDGNMWELSKASFGSAAEALEDARVKGIEELERAERVWSASHIDYALATNMNLAGYEEEDEDVEWGCLVLFLCGALIVLALLGWGIWLACGRWPSLCRTVPLAGAVILGLGIAAWWRAMK